MRAALRREIQLDLLDMNWSNAGLVILVMYVRCSEISMRMTGPVAPRDSSTSISSIDFHDSMDKDININIDMNISISGGNYTFISFSYQEQEHSLNTT